MEGLGWMGISSGHSSVFQTASTGPQCGSLLHWERAEKDKAEHLIGDNKANPAGPLTNPEKRYQVPNVSDHFLNVSSFQRGL